MISDAERRRYLHTGKVYYEGRYKEDSLPCRALGVSGTTKVFVRETEDDGGHPMFTARMGVAILGVTNRKDEGLAEANPFDRDFCDNFVEGVGLTVDDALLALKKDVQSLSDSLWA